MGKVIPWEDCVFTNYQEVRYITEYGDIYCIEDMKTNQVVYVGQTTDFERRKKAHFMIAFNPKATEYNYPLYKAIRENGTDRYNIYLLDFGVPKDLLLEKEREYIEKYNVLENGFNNISRGKECSFSKATKEQIDIVYAMLQENRSFYDIQQATGLSFPHISNINYGTRNRREGYEYPLRTVHAGGKLTDDDVNEIVQLLKTTKMKQEDIARQFNIEQTVISQINLGKRRNIPNRDCLTFPLRTFKQKTLKRIIPLPSRSMLKCALRVCTHAEIEKKFGLSVKSLNNRCEFYGLPSSLHEIRKMTDEEWDAL